MVKCGHGNTEQLVTMKKKNTKDSVFVVRSVRFRKDIYEKLARIAAENNRSITGQLAEFITKAEENN